MEFNLKELKTTIQELEEKIEKEEASDIDNEKYKIACKKMAEFYRGMNSKYFKKYIFKILSATEYEFLLYEEVRRRKPSEWVKRERKFFVRSIIDLYKIKKPHKCDYGKRSAFNIYSSFGGVLLTKRQQSKVKKILEGKAKPSISNFKF